MLFQRHSPRFPLADFVENFTYYEDYAPAHSVERVLPEGVVEIILDLTEEPKWMHDNATLRASRSFRGAWVSGMRSKYISIGVAGRSAMFIIRFRPGKAYPFLQVPLREVDNLVIDSDLLLDRGFADFRCALIEAPNSVAKFELAEAFILRRMRDHMEVNPVIDFVVGRLAADPCTATISDVIQRTGYSHKHLLTLFSKYVGLSPKEFLRVLKFQQAIQNLERTKRVDWGRLAQDCAYYDQSHFINDFKGFSGFAPSEYLRLKHEFVNYVPVL